MDNKTTSYGWTAAEDKYIKSHYGRLTSEQIARILTGKLRILTGDSRAARSPEDVDERATHLGLRGGVGFVPTQVALSMQKLNTLAALTVLDLKALTNEVLDAFALIVRLPPPKLAEVKALVDAEKRRQGLV